MNLFALLSAIIGAAVVVVIFKFGSKQEKRWLQKFTTSARFNSWSFSYERYDGCL